MDQSQKKTLLVKTKAVARILKQYKAYKQEVSNYDMNVVSQDKKKAEFYKQSTSALESVKKNLVQFVLQLQSFMDQNKNQIEQVTDPILVGQVQKGKQSISQARSLLPAEL